MINFTEQETELHNAAKNYALIINKKLSCKPFQEKTMERSYLRYFCKITSLR